MVNCRKDYYQEGSHVYGELNVLEAFRKALTTWARWVDANVNPSKSFVFFRGYSASHFRYAEEFVVTYIDIDDAFLYAAFNLFR